MLAVPSGGRKSDLRPMSMPSKPHFTFQTRIGPEPRKANRA